MAKRQFSVRLRPDQEEQLELMLKNDPEMDASKIIRKAVDEYIAARVKEEPQRFRTKKKGQK